MKRTTLIVFGVFILLLGVAFYVHRTGGGPEPGLTVEIPGIRGAHGDGTEEEPAGLIGPPTVIEIETR